MNRRLTIKEKLDVLRKLEEPKANHSVIAKSFGISRRSVRRIFDSRSELKIVERNGTSKKRCHIKHMQKFEVISTALHEWFIKWQEQHGDVPISEAVLRTVATRFSQRLKNQEFKCSNGWLRSWKKRYGVKSLEVSLSAL